MTYPAICVSLQFFSPCRQITQQSDAATERRSTFTVPFLAGGYGAARPRCGSNLVAIAILAQGLLLSLPSELERASWTIAAGVVLITLLVTAGWRPLGRFLQAAFTTRRANERQLANGIAVGVELLQRYQLHPAYRARWWRQLWNFGLLQMLGGWVVTMNLLEYAGLWR